MLRLAYHRDRVNVAGDYDDCDSIYEDGLKAALAGEWAVALERFRAAGRAIPRSAAHINSMGVAYLSLGNAGRPAACFRRASRLDAGNADIFRHLGRALWTLGRQEPALAALPKAVDLDPRQGCSRNALATALLR